MTDINKQSKLSILFTLLLALTSYLTPLQSYGEAVFFDTNKLAPNESGTLLRSPATEILYTYSFLDLKHYLCFNAGIKFPFMALLNPGGIETEWGAVGGIYTRFELMTASFNFLHSDFFIALYEDFKIKPFVWGLMFYHVSSHLGDDYVRLYSPPIADTGYEVLRTNFRYLGKLIIPEFGVEWILARRHQAALTSPFSFYTGIQVSLLTLNIPLFFESEAELFDFRQLPNLGFRVGLYLKHFFNSTLLRKNNNKETKEYHQLNITYYYGLSKQGYFTDRRESLLLIGPAFRF
jgi:hypothetical protein